MLKSFIYSFGAFLTNGSIPNLDVIMNDQNVLVPGLNVTCDLFLDAIGLGTAKVGTKNRSTLNRTNSYLTYMPDVTLCAKLRSEFKSSLNNAKLELTLLEVQLNSTVHNASLNQNKLYVDATNFGKTPAHLAFRSVTAMSTNKIKAMKDRKISLNKDSSGFYPLAFATTGSDNKETLKFSIFTDRAKAVSAIVQSYASMEDTALVSKLDLLLKQPKTSAPSKEGKEKPSNELVENALATEQAAIDAASVAATAVNSSQEAQTAADDAVQTAENALTAASKAKTEADSHLRSVQKLNATGSEPVTTAQAKATQAEGSEKKAFNEKEAAVKAAKKAKTDYNKAEKAKQSADTEVETTAKDRKAEELAYTKLLNAITGESDADLTQEEETEEGADATKMTELCGRFLDASMEKLYAESGSDIAKVTTEVISSEVDNLAGYFDALSSLKVDLNEVSTVLKFNAAAVVKSAKAGDREAFKNSTDTLIITKVSDAQKKSSEGELSVTGANLANVCGLSTSKTREHESINVDTLRLSHNLRMAVLPGISASMLVHDLHESLGDVQVGFDLSWQNTLSAYALGTYAEQLNKNIFNTGATVGYDASSDLLYDNTFAQSAYGKELFPQAYRETTAKSLADSKTADDKSFKKLAKLSDQSIADDFKNVQLSTGRFGITFHPVVSRVGLLVGFVSCAESFSEINASTLSPYLGLRISASSSEAEDIVQDAAAEVGLEEN